MDRITLALATDDGEYFIDRHFGDADLYKIYKISKNTKELIKEIDNSVGEKEDMHADPKRAKGIVSLLNLDYS